MSKKMLINANAAEEVRVAIVDNGVLTDLDIETEAREKTRGNIYKGIVANVEASLDAAFIEFGQAKQGFLAFDDLRPELWDPAWKGEGRPRITDVLHRRQEIVVQVIKEEMGSKGAAVTSYLSLPGRYVVLMHSGGGRGGVSRKIDDEKERAKAKEILDKLKAPENLGVIIRTAGMGKNRPELQKDLNQLSRQWQKIMSAADIARAPSLLYREPDLVVRTIRDYLTPEIDEVWIDDPEEHEEAVAYFSGGSADGEPAEDKTDAKKGANLIRCYQGSVPLFEKYGVEEQIEALYKREVPLPSGGYLIIDQTEALVAIDVNSGKSTREGDHESTVYKTNLEAAAEVARQLRLRDMGGIVVVDFIDMVSRRHDRDVERRLKEAVHSDKARVKIGRISDNGLLELTRQRLRQAHRLVSHVPCQACRGTGVVRAVPGQSVAALRELQTRAAAHQGSLARLTARLPLDVANHLQNHKRRELDELCGQYNLLVEVLADPTLSMGDARFEEERRGRAAMAAPPPPVVRDEDWRGKRRYRGEERPETPADTIEDRQEQRFHEDRQRPTKAGKERPARPARPDKPTRPEVPAEAPTHAPEEVRAVVARLRPEPATKRHYPDDALMDALFGDPPELAPEPQLTKPVPAPAPTVVPHVQPEPAGTDVPGPALPAVTGETPPDAALLPTGEEGTGKKRRRRRRRRKKGGGTLEGAVGTPPSMGTGELVAQDGVDEQDGDEELEDLELSDGKPASGDQAAPHPQFAAAPDRELIAAASDLLLMGQEWTDSNPAPSWQESEPPVHPGHVQPEEPLPLESAFLAPPVATMSIEPEPLAPLPPPGPAEPEASTTSEAPTVIAKRTRKPRAPRTKTESAPAKPPRKKAPAKKKTSRRSAAT